MRSEMKQNKVSQEMTVCACAERASQGNGLQNYLAECCTAPARVSLTVHSQWMISPGTALLQLCQALSPHWEAALLPRNNISCLCLFTWRGICKAVLHSGKGSSIFLRMEKHLLCGRENFLWSNTEFPQFTLWGVSIGVRLEEGDLGWFWEALTQKGESDS